MEDISEEQFKLFAYSYVTRNVLDNNQQLEYFYQDDKKVIIKTNIRNCIFLYSEGFYKLKYIEDKTGLWLVYSDNCLIENLNSINKGSQNTNLVIFEKKEDNKIYFTHIDCDYDKINEVIITYIAKVSNTK